MPIERGLALLYPPIMSDRESGFTPKDSHYARLRRTHRDKAREAAGSAPRTSNARKDKHGASASRSSVPDGLVQLYGLHTVSAALINPARRLHRLVATRNALNRMELNVDALACPLELVEPKVLDRELGEDAVHQGVMLETDPLPTKSLQNLGAADLVLVLDQVTDPHNVGAVLRSAVAFGAGALVTTSRHSPQESGVLAKAASGALEHIPYIQIGNLADALGELSRLGYQTIGLDSDGDAELETALAAQRIALVLGSEGKGLRQKTRQSVDALARLEMPGAIRSLNVSNAAAVALYATRRHIG